jgi:hypothetical protein
MSRDINGNYTLPSAVNPVVAGTVITANWGNTTLNDVAAALTDSLSRSGNGGMTAPLRFADGTVSAPSITFSTETTTGFYRAGVGDFRVTILGVQVLQMVAGSFVVSQPTFIPTPTYPAGGGSPNQAVTASYVDVNFAPIVSPTFTGTPRGPTAVTGTGGTQLATQAYVDATSFTAALPAQTGNAGLEVTTNGTGASWGLTIPGALAILNVLNFGF